MGRQPRWDGQRVLAVRGGRQRGGAAPAAELLGPPVFSSGFRDPSPGQSDSRPRGKEKFVCVRCYAGLEGGDRGGDGSVYCPSRCVRVERPRVQRGCRTPPLRPWRRPRRGLRRPELWPWRRARRTRRPCVPATSGRPCAARASGLRPCWLWGPRKRQRRGRPLPAFSPPPPQAPR